jgi:hypothetical protein
VSVLVMVAVVMEEKNELEKEEEGEEKEGARRAEDLWEPFRRRESFFVCVSMDEVTSSVWCDDMSVFDDVGKDMVAESSFPKPLPLIMTQRGRE